MIAPGTALEAVQVTLPGAPVVGQVAPGGQFVHLGKLDGWWDSPASSGTSTQKVAEHGVHLSPAYYGGRVLNLEARIDGFSPGDSLALARQLMASVSPNQLVTLSVTDELGTLTAAVRQEGDPLLSRQGNRMVVSLSLLAPDPRRYGAAQIASTGLPTSSGGLVLPIVLPLASTAALVTGVLSAYNEGDMDSQPVFYVAGPCPPFTITDQDGRQLAAADSVPTGRTLIIDTAAKTALLDGTEARVVTGTWPVLKPGANSFRFDANSYDAGAQLSISYRSAWR